MQKIFKAIVILMITCTALWALGDPVRQTNLCKPTATKPLKKGVSSFKTLFWFIPFEICPSIEKSMKNGGMTKIFFAETKFTTIGFFFYNDYSIVVYGE